MKRKPGDLNVWLWILLLLLLIYLFTNLSNIRRCKIINKLLISLIARYVTYFTFYITQPPTYVWHQIYISKFPSLHKERTTQTHYCDNRRLGILNVKLYLIYEKNILLLLYWVLVDIWYMLY